MSSLAKIQGQIRAAILNGPGADIDVTLVGGREPLARLAIHRRHYETSLIDALLRRYPAVQWLVGTPSVTKAARAYIYRRPPATPCLAEYGGEFPAFLASWPPTEGVPGLRWFGELEWRLGEVALCVDHPACAMATLANVATSALPDVVIQLQPGLRYFKTPWPVDELMALYLAESAPSRYVFEPCSICLQIAGARGAVRVERLQEADFVFRRALADGAAVGVAAEQALDAELTFDPGRALSSLVAERLVIGFKISPGPD